MSRRKELCCMSAGPVAHGSDGETGPLHLAQKKRSTNLCENYRDLLNRTL
jgi:hypothetical protein